MKVPGLVDTRRPISSLILVLAIALLAIGGALTYSSIGRSPSGFTRGLSGSLPLATGSLGACSPSIVCSRAVELKAALVGANLTGVDLSHQDLSFANLENASLVGANLNGADLRNANLLGANVTLAQLANAYLCGTVLPSGYVDNSDCSG